MGGIFLQAILLVLLGLTAVSFSQQPANLPGNDNTIYLGPSPRTEPAGKGPFRPPPLPPDLLYDTLHDPWFDRLPWGSPVSAAAPKGAKAAFERGFKHWWKHSWKEAEPDFREAVTIDPRFARAWDYLGLTLQSEDRITEAGQAFQRALEIEPEFIPPYSGLIEVADAQNNSSRALELAKRAMPLAERASVSVRVDQLAGQHSKDMDVTSFGFRVFVRVQRVRMQIASARAYLISGDTAHAEVLAQQAYVWNPLSLQVAMLFTDILMKEGRSQGAEEILRKFVRSRAAKNDKKLARDRLNSLKSQGD